MSNQFSEEYYERLKEEFAEDSDGLKTNNAFQQKFGGLMKIYDS